MIEHKPIRRLSRTRSYEGALNTENPDENVQGDTTAAKESGVSDSATVFQSVSGIPRSESYAQGIDQIGSGDGFVRPKLSSDHKGKMRMGSVRRQNPLFADSDEDEQGSIPKPTAVDYLDLDHTQGQHSSAQQPGADSSSAEIGVMYTNPLRTSAPATRAAPPVEVVQYLDLQHASPQPVVDSRRHDDVEVGVMYTNPITHETPKQARRASATTSVDYLEVQHDPLPSVEQAAPPPINLKRHPSVRKSPHHLQKLALEREKSRRGYRNRSEGKASSSGAGGTEDNWSQILAIDPGANQPDALPRALGHYATPIPLEADDTPGISLPGYASVLSSYAPSRTTSTVREDAPKFMNDSGINNGIAAAPSLFTSDGPESLTAAGGTSGSATSENDTPFTEDEVHALLAELSTGEEDEDVLEDLLDEDMAMHQPPVTATMFTPTGIRSRGGVFSKSGKDFANRLSRLSSDPASQSLSEVAARNQGDE